MIGVIFDLDGTLWNTSSLCAEAWNKAIRVANIRKTPITEDDIARVSGLPFLDCVKNLFPDIGEESLYTIAPLIEKYERQEIETKGGTLYKGVSKYLDILSVRLPLFVVSNCQHWYLQAFLSMPLKSSNTSKTFRDIFVDSECFGRTQNPKAENITAICQRNSLEDAVYIGDTEGDRLAAMKAGIHFIHVSYGFGHLESTNVLSAASFSKVVEMLLRNTGVGNSGPPKSD